MNAPLTDGAPLDVRFNSIDERLISALLAPLRLWTSPKFYGIENIPQSGAIMLAGNHNLYGGLDAPLFADEVQRRTGRVLRGLAEDILMVVPGVRQVLHRWGAVRANRDNCRALFANGEAVLVFPGGGREAVRRKNEKYALLWDERTGFARMAIEAGVPIYPVGAIGVDDAFDILVDADHPALKPVRAVAERFGFRWELAPPLSRGIGPTPIMRPERFYFSVGTPIDTTPWVGSPDLNAAACEVRDLVRKGVEEEIRFLIDERSRDSGRTLRGRLAQAFA
ncbi:lysophospholipid acyltransferase family protein [Antrihabitans sp. YC2-6]|uniref:lysophospholipid acyltransferase family protein n=1 Tax=Antrihabitans sp. YC2-6 TaxID=2799498 RepID=UPI0018F60334|nr:lysophospholipid acyltransferase family protein [Antrihabitans sp. YC2-6]MBJ8345434.1 acyltransferase family protein [Antrihabitans sp. YC2-6]